MTNTLLEPRKLLLFSVLLSALTLASFGYDWLHSRAHVQTLVETRVREKAIISTNQLKTLMELYTQTLYGARGLMSISTPVSRVDWHNYYQNLGTTKRLPGLRSLAYLPLVKASQRDSFIAQVQSDRSLEPQGYPNFAIHPLTGSDEHVVIDYLEPSNLTSLQQTFGFDILTEKTRLEALQKTRDTNQPILSEPTKSLSSSQTSFVMMLPVYDPSLQTITPVQRRQAFKGVINLVFRTQELFDQVFIEYVNSDTQVEVFDGETTDPAHLLYDSSHQQKVLGAVDPSEPVVITTTTQVADRTWTLRFTNNRAATRFFILPSVTSRILFLLASNLITAIVVFLISRQTQLAQLGQK